MTFRSTEQRLVADGLGRLLLGHRDGVHHAGVDGLHVTIQCGELEGTASVVGRVPAQVLEVRLGENRLAGILLIHRQLHTGFVVQIQRLVTRFCIARRDLRDADEHRCLRGIRSIEHGLAERGVTVMFGFGTEGRARIIRLLGGFLDREGLRLRAGDVLVLGRHRNELDLVGAAAVVDGGIPLNLAEISLVDELTCRQVAGRAPVTQRHDAGVRVLTIRALDGDDFHRIRGLFGVRSCKRAGLRVLGQRTLESIVRHIELHGFSRVHTQLRLGIHHRGRGFVDGDGLLGSSLQCIAVSLNRRELEGTTFTLGGVPGHLVEVRCLDQCAVGNGGAIDLERACGKASGLDSLGLVGRIRPFEDFLADRGIGVVVSDVDGLVGLVGGLSLDRSRGRGLVDGDGLYLGASDFITVSGDRLELDRTAFGLGGIPG